MMVQSWMRVGGVCVDGLKNQGYDFKDVERPVELSEYSTRSM